MRVRITFDFRQEEREALAEQSGHAMPMGHADLRRWAAMELRATLDVIVAEHEELTRETEE